MTTSDPEHTPDPAREHQAHAPLLLELELAPGEDLTGSVGPPGTTDAQSFHGWIAFMSALNTLRAAADPHADPSV